MKYKVSELIKKGMFNYFGKSINQIDGTEEVVVEYRGKTGKILYKNGKVVKEDEVEWSG